VHESFVDQVEHLGAGVETGQIPEIGDAVLALIDYSETLGFSLKVSQAFALIYSWRVARAGFAAAEAVVISSRSRPSPIPRELTT
jgi:hypothetical protein